MGIAVIGSTFVDIKGMPLTTYIPAGRNEGRVQTVHGGVCRNVAEDIANMELHPTFISLVDDNGTGQDVLNRLQAHGCGTEYIRRGNGMMGTWLAVFDNTGDVVASISYRPDLSEIGDILREQGDQIFSQADSVIIEVDLEENLVLRVLDLAEKWKKTVYGVVSNMSIALKRRALLKKLGCIVCNQQEAGIFFSQHFEDMTTHQLMDILPGYVRAAGLQRMVVTLGGSGSIWIEQDGEHGFCPPLSVDVIDTTGAGDAFFAGVAAGLTYGKSLALACRIGTRLAASVIATTQSVCPSFRREEFGF